MQKFRTNASVRRLVSTGIGSFLLYYKKRKKVLKIVWLKKLPKYGNLFQAIKLKWKNLEISLTIRENDSAVKWRGKVWYVLIWRKMYLLHCKKD